MKNKILAILPEGKIGSKEYLTYCFKLTMHLKGSLDILIGTSKIHFRTNRLRNTSKIYSVDNSDVKNQQILKRILEILESSNLDLSQNKIRLDTSVGLVEDKITSTESEENYVLILTENRSESTLLNKINGIKELDLVNLTTAPTLLIPEKEVYHTPKKMLCIFNKAIGVELIKLLEIQSLFDFDLTLAQLNTDNTSNNLTSALLHELDKRSIKIIDQINFNTFNYQQEINSIVESRKTDWISFFGFDSDPLGRMWKISTNELILSSNIPILIP